jgi:hypothetical protein
VAKKLPLLFIPFLLYNIICVGAAKTGTLATIPLPSGAQWAFSVDDLIVSLGLFFLFFEVVKSTRTSTSSIVDHGLSMLLFTLCVVEFVTVQAAGKSTFFFIMTMCAVDVIAGFTVTITSARRDYGPAL